MGSENREIEAVTGALEALDGPQDRFLLVEDDPESTWLMTRLMKKVGVSVEAVGTVREGIAALSRMPSVVILDLRLPDGCGVEVLEAIRSAKMRCKVAVVSVSTDEAIFARVRAAGPDAVFAKPLDFEDFVQWLCEAFPESSRIARPKGTVCHRSNSSALQPLWGIGTPNGIAPLNC